MAVGEKEAIEELARTHPKFRAFANEIDACMQLFERSREWSDYVSALSKLIKVFQRPDYNDANKVGSLSIIPEKGLLARRLNQCTNPILPSGVHRKALDAYRVIIVRIGLNQLASDLALWSSGLFSLFPHANTECKHLELKLFSEFFLPLGPQLTPCMNGLIMSLLPGIEDEASEFFSQTNKVLDEIRLATSPSQFFHSLWWILSCCSSVRQPVLRLIEAQLTLQGSLELPLVRASVLPDHGTLVLGSLRAALDDTSILVQRALLDLLVGHFPMTLNIWDEKQWRVLIRNALRLYGRRDMSLTRRLHTWLGVSSDDGGELLSSTVLERLVSSLSSLLCDEYRDTVGATLPFRVLRVLTEKAQLSERLPKLLAVKLLVSLKEARPPEGAKQAATLQGTSASKDYSKERYQFGCSLLREFDPRLLWSALSVHMNSSCEDDASLAHNLDLVSFFLSEFGTDPGLCVAADPVALSVDALTLVAHRLCHEAQILPVMWANCRLDESHHLLVRIKLMLSFLLFTVENLKGVPNVLGQGAESTFDKLSARDAAEAGSTPLHHVSNFLSLLVNQVLRLPPSKARGASRDKVWEYALDCLDTGLALLGSMFQLMRCDDALMLTKSQPGDANSSSCSHDVDISRSGKVARRDWEKKRDCDWLTTLFECCEVDSAIVFCAGIRALLDARDTFGAEQISMRWPMCGRSDWSGLAATLWTALDDEAAAAYAGDLFLRVHRIDERSCRSLVSRALLGEPGVLAYGGLSDETINARKLGYVRFGRFWSLSQKKMGKDERNDSVFSHGLMLTLDGLRDGDHTIQLLARTFVVNALASIERVLDPVLGMLLQAGESTRVQIDSPRVAYVMSRLCALVELTYEHLRASSDRPVTSAVRRIDSAWVRTVLSSSLVSEGSASSPASDKGQSTNDVWLRQQHQRSGAIDCLPPNCDYLSALVIIAGRFISAKFKSLSPSEFANLRSMAASLLIGILHRETDIDVASQMVNLVAMPVLLTLQAALRDNDATTQVKLLELLGAMFARTNGHLLPSQHLHGDALGLARQLFVRTLLAGLEHDHPLDLPSSDSWIDFACSCVSFQQSHVRLEGFLIPMLVSLCKRLAKRCPCLYSDGASHELLSLVRAIHLVFRTSIPQDNAGECSRRTLSCAPGPQPLVGSFSSSSSREMMLDGARETLTAPAGQGNVPGAASARMFGNWTMFGGADSGQIQSGNSDEAIETLIKLLVPPGWIPAADGTTSVLGAMLMCWGPGSAIDGGLPGGSNQRAVRSSVFQVIFWLFDAFPLQTLAALLQVWDTDMSAVQRGAKSWRCETSGLPTCCASICEVMSEVGRQYPEEERLLQKCMELIVQLVRRKKNDISFKFKFTEASLRQFSLAYLVGRPSVDPSLRLLPTVTDTLKEAVASSDDPIAVLGLFQLFDAYVKRLPALSDKKNRRALQECLHLMVNANLTLADMSLGPKAKSSLSIVGGEAGGNSGVAGPGDVLDLGLVMARRKTGLDALEALSEHLASLLEKAWRDGEERVELMLLSGDLGSQRDRFAPLIAKVVMHLKPIIRARTSSMMLHAGAATKVLASLNHPMFVKLWRKDVLELFQDSDFFQMGSSAEHHWLNLVDVVMSQEAGAFTDLLGTSPLNAVFKLNMMGQENNKYRQHADYIKRLAFVVLAGDVDQYLAGMHEILEKLVEALRLPLGPGVARIYKHSFLCMRVLLLRISSSSLVSFWPIVLSEVSRILLMATSWDTDMDMCYAALRFLDILMTLEPEEFLLMQWAFVLPYRMDDDTEPRSYLFSPATQTLAMEMKSKMDHTQLMQYFAVDEGASKGAAPNRLEMRRPLLQRLEVMSREELIMASMLLANSKSSDVVESRRADIDFIFHAIRKEFDEFHDVTQPTLTHPESNGHGAKAMFEKRMESATKERRGDVASGSDLD